MTAGRSSRTCTSPAAGPTQSHCTRRGREFSRREQGRGLRPSPHLPPPPLPRSSRDFSPDVHHNDLQPMQLWVVWSLPPQGGSGGPNNLHRFYSPVVSRTAIYQSVPPPSFVFTTQISRFSGAAMWLYLCRISRRLPTSPALQALGDGAG